MSTVTVPPVCPLLAGEPPLLSPLLLELLEPPQAPAASASAPITPTATGPRKPLITMALLLTV
jgi:hypothetical protein